jgi:TadE-like protein
VDPVTLVRGQAGDGSERGAELVEFALVLPLLMVVIMGVFDFGLAFQRYEVITNAAREGARMGSLEANYCEADIRSRVTAYASAAGLPAAPITVVNWNVAIPVPGGPAITGVQVIVTYGHGFALVGPILGLINGSLGSVTLRAESTMRSEGPKTPC